MISRDHNFVALIDSQAEVMSTVCFQKRFKSDLCPGLALEVPAGMPKGVEQRVWCDESGLPSGGWDGGNSGGMGGMVRGVLGGASAGMCTGYPGSAPEPQCRSPTPGEGSLDVIPRAAGSQAQGETECPHLFPTPCLLPTIPFPRSRRLLSAL